MHCFAFPHNIFLDAAQEEEPIATHAALRRSRSGKMSGSDERGIQKLMAAEQEAQEIVGKARKGAAPAQLQHPRNC